MKLWKRNVIVVAIVVFVGAAVYLNWSYGQAEDASATPTGKVLGEAALVNGAANAGQDGQDASAAPDGEGKGGEGEGETDGSTHSTSTGYFASARLNRQQARDSALEILQQAAADAMADQTVIDNANASIQQLAANTLSEAQVENLVTAKGYHDCVCYINDRSASVVVSATAAGLTDVDTARIVEIVMDETGLSASNITIIEAKP